MTSLWLHVDSTSQGKKDHIAVGGNWLSVSHGGKPKADTDIKCYKVIPFG